MFPKATGRLIILEQLGRGGLVTVYKAHAPQLERHLDLKNLIVLTGNNRKLVQNKYNEFLSSRGSPVDGKVGSLQG